MSAHTIPSVVPVVVPKAGNISSSADLNYYPDGNNMSYYNSTDYFQEFAYYDVTFQQVIVVLNTYVIPAIIVMGFIGNTISFSVFVGTHLNRQSSSMYLAFLAAVDNIFLITLLFVWFGWVEINIFQRNGWCQSILYCTYVCSFLSVWTVLGFTAERYIVVFYPLRRQRLCTRKRAIVVMLTLTVSSLAFYSFSIMTYGVQYQNNVPSCRLLLKYYNIHKVMTSIDTVIALIVPTASIIALNAAIAIKVYNYTRKNLKLDQTNYNMAKYYTNPSSSGTGGHHTNLVVEYDSGVSTQNSRTYPNPDSSIPSRLSKTRQWRLSTKRQLSQMRVTRALLIISTVFIVLNLPSHAFRILAFVMSFAKGTIPYSAYTWFEFLQFLYYLSFSANFLLYMLFSRNFRGALRRLIRRTIYNFREMDFKEYFTVRNKVCFSFRTQKLQRKT